MKYWLLKTEPEEWSWNQQVKSGGRGAEWNGVRNFQARKNLKNMKIGNKCFFYHTGKEKSIVGVVKVIKESFLDSSDKSGKFVSIVVKALYPLKREVKLEDIKKNLCRCVCTLRPKSEGGLFVGKEDERKSILRLIAEYNPLLLDVEFNTIEKDRKLASYLKKTKCKLSGSVIRLAKA